MVVKKLKTVLVATLFLLLSTLALWPFTSPIPDSGEYVHTITTDSDIDNQVLSVIKKSIKTNHADSAQVIVYSVSAKKIISICSTDDSSDSCTRQNIYNTYSPGSVIKSLSLAAALDSGSINTSFQAAYKSDIKIDGITIRNYTDFNLDNVNLENILSISLNTGMAQIYQEMLRSEGATRASNILTDYLYEKFMLGSSSHGVDCYKCEVSLHNVPNKDYRGASMMFGMGMVSTPMNIVRAYSVFPGDGKMMWGDTQEKRVLDYSNTEFTKSILKDLLESRDAYIKSCTQDSVYGKSGTSPSVSFGRYNSEYEYGNFVGGIETEDARFVLFVKLDNPKGDLIASSYAADLWIDIYKKVLSSCR